MSEILLFLRSDSVVLVMLYCIFRCAVTLLKSCGQKNKTKTKLLYIVNSVEKYEAPFTQKFQLTHTLTHLQTKHFSDGQCNNRSRQNQNTFFFFFFSNL